MSPKAPGNEELIFSGHCEKCSEAFEATSKSDDLEGITFKCRKVFCTGRVTLGPGRPGKSLPPKDPTPPKDKSSRRYC